MVKEKNKQNGFMKRNSKEYDKIFQKCNIITGNNMINISIIIFYTENTIIL